MGLYLTTVVGFQLLKRTKDICMKNNCPRRTNLLKGWNLKNFFCLMAKNFHGWNLTSDISTQIIIVKVSMLKKEKKKNLASLSNNFKIMQKVNTCVAYWHLIGSWINPNGTIEISSFNIFVCAIAYSNRSDTVLGHVKLCEPQGAAGSVESFILMDWILLSNTQFYSSNLIIEYYIYILTLKTLYEMN